MLRRHRMRLRSFPTPAARLLPGRSRVKVPRERVTTKTRSRPTVASLVELVVIVAIALGLALGIQAFIVKPYRIPSGSMEPTLSIGQRVLVNRIGMDFSDPHVGEIAVFHPPEGAEQEECGPSPHVIRLGAAACSEPVPKQDSGVNFI